MRAPRFWRRDGGWARLLAPLSAVYDTTGRLRRRMARPERAAVPVICVGNATVGGTGKTPVALDLAGRLAARGRRPHLLMRGYGGRRAEAPLQVDLERHGAAEVGDEALLLARAAPTWVSPDRVAGARAAVAAGAGAIVMDDGLQNPRLHKDLSLLVVDGGAGFGNARVLPAGPLRERLPRALERADAVVLVGSDRAGVTEMLKDARPVLTARLVPDAAGAALAGRRVLAFAGIGRPEKLFATLRELGAEIVEQRAFADHHRYTEAEIRELLARAEALTALPVTTEKDAVRLPDRARHEVAVLAVRLAWDDPARLDLLLDPLFADGQG